MSEHRLPGSGDGELVQEEREMRRPTSLATDASEAFISGCERLGVEATDFRLFSEEDVPLHPGPTRRYVIVEKGEVSLEFDAGTGADWISAVLEAIEEGRFVVTAP